MSKNYLSVECNGECIEDVVIQNDNGEFVFTEVVDMTYNDIKNYEHLEEFVVAIMDATNVHFGSNDDDTIVTLVGEDDIFIWSIIIVDDDEDMIKYALVDWKKDGKSYRYEK